MNNFLKNLKKIQEVLIVLTILIVFTLMVVAVNGITFMIITDPLILPLGKIILGLIVLTLDFSMFIKLLEILPELKEDFKYYIKKRKRRISKQKGTKYE